MIKTILVPTSGSDTDYVTFDMALSIAKSFNAHLEFFHLHPSDGDAVAYMPHADFVLGSAVRNVVDAAHEQSSSLSARALRHVHEFCKNRGIEMHTTPPQSRSVTATWYETSEPVASLMCRARHCDITIVGRRRHTDFMPADLLENLVLKSGRPILIVPESAPRECIRTIVVGWEETPEAARALGAALPLLKQARDVHIVSIEEPGSAGAEVLTDLATHLAWHGVAAHIELISGHEATGRELSSVAMRLRADLLVGGAFGRGRLREAAFGGVTQDLIERADCPILLVH